MEIFIHNRTYRVNWRNWSSTSSSSCISYLGQWSSTSRSSCINYLAKWSSTSSCICISWFKQGERGDNFREKVVSIIVATSTWGWIACKPAISTTDTVSLLSVGTYEGVTSGLTLEKVWPTTFNFIKFILFPFNNSFSILHKRLEFKLALYTFSNQ